MKAAVVREAGQPPVFGDFPDPVPVAGQSLVEVRAAAISPVTRSRASGTHYSATAAEPFVPGVDGVLDGRRVYFIVSERPFGAMAERTVVDERRLIAIPDELTSETAAAMAIPAMSSWAALVERARFKPGEAVLVNGATGASGRLAIQVARHLGAEKIVATGRRTETFDALRRLGADVTISLHQGEEALEAAFRSEFEHGIDVVLDYLWGPSAQALAMAAAKAGPEGVPIRHVQIGSIGGASIELPGAALRSSALQLMGSGIGSVPMERLVRVIEEALKAAPGAGFEISFETRPLTDVTEVWRSGGGGADSRIVLQP